MVLVLGLVAHGDSTTTKGGRGPTTESPRKSNSTTLSVGRSPWTIFGQAVCEADPQDEAGDELVGAGLIEEPGVGVVGLFGWGGERLAPVAEGADRGGGQQGRFGGVAHGIGDRGVEALPVDRVVEGVPAGGVGRLQPAGQGEGASFGGVGGGEEAPLDLRDRVRDVARRIRCRRSGCQ